MSHVVEFFDIILLIFLPTLSAQKKTGEVSAGETKLFSEGSLGSTPEGQGMNTYRELCAIATDLNQPDLIYKFLHLANHQSMWNSRKVNIAICIGVR